MASNHCDNVALMSINATKAGMEGLDKAAVNAIIEEASKGSKFYEAKAKAQKRIDAKKEIMLEKLKNLSEDSILNAQSKADKTIQELKFCEWDTSQVVVHVDMDAFYAAVEEKDDPSLKSHPMAVGSMGMLSTSNYLARKFGVRAGMPGFIGKKLCPNLKIVPLNFDKYRAVSAQVRQVFKEYDANFCPMSLDEAYLNLTEYLLQHPSLAAGEVVEEMRTKIFQKTDLTASAGISFNTLLAKICSDLNKPNGQYELLDEDKVKSFVPKLAVRKVGGIGNVTEQLLEVLGITTCQDILDQRGRVHLLFSELSSVGFFRVALGIGCTDVAAMANSERKSMSTETTFKDTSDPEKLREICKELSQELSSDLQNESLVARQVTVKIKTHKFAIKTKVSNLLRPTSDFQIIHQTALKILQKFIDCIEEKPLTLRLLGVRASDLLDQAQAQDSDKSIRNFFAVADSKTETFHCPLCGKSVQARNEQAFCVTHFEKCSNSVLEQSETVASTHDVSKGHQCTTSKVGDFPKSSCFPLLLLPPLSSSTCNEKDLQQEKVDFNCGLPRETSVVTTSTSSDLEEPASRTCPVCREGFPHHFDSSLINSHIDLCLNAPLIQNCSSSNKRKIASPHKSPLKSKKSKLTSIKSYFTKN